MLLPPPPHRATCCAVHLQAVYSRSCRCRCDASLVGCLERLITLPEITEALCLAWEVLIEIAAILHCCEAMSPYCGGAPFEITSGSTVSAVQRININIYPAKYSHCCHARAVVLSTYVSKWLSEANLLWCGGVFSSIR